MLALMRIRHSWLAVFRWIAAGILGYELIVALTTLGFVDWLDNADLYRGDWQLEAQGLLVAVVSGLAGGALAGGLGGGRPMPHALGVLPFLCIDTSYVLFVYPRTTPFWFELMGGLGLITATVAGGALVALGRRGWSRKRARTSAGTILAWCGTSAVRHILVAVPFVLFDASYAVAFFPGKVPVWFDVLGGLLLIAVALPGGGVNVLPAASVQGAGGATRRPLARR